LHSRTLAPLHHIAASCVLRPVIRVMHRS
jgi:hypothetical protein